MAAEPSPEHPSAHSPEHSLRAVVFDMDGVLIDSERIIRQAWTEAALERGFHLPDELFQRVIGSASGTAGKVIDELMGPTFPARDVFHAAQQRVAHAVADGWPQRSGAGALLASLHALNVPVAVASSTRRAQVVVRLESAGLLPFVQAICAGDEVERGKPHPEIYQTAASHINVPPTHCIGVEDSMHGVAAAEAAGMFTVLVPDMVPAPLPLPPIVHACVADIGAVAALIHQKLE